MFSRQELGVMASNAEYTRPQQLLMACGQLAGRAALGLTVSTASMAAVPAEAVTSSARVSAEFTNTYPDMDASDCSTVYGVYSWCKDRGWLSGRGYGYRNCTDGVAYWVRQYIGTDIRGWGNAKNWDAAAPRGTLYQGTTQGIEPGDIAQSSDGSYGHVGFVIGVNKREDGTVTSFTAAELNRGGNGEFTINTYSTRNSNGLFNRGGSHVWDTFIDLNGLGKGLNNTPLAPAGAPLPHGASPIQNGGFNGGYAHWSAHGEANIAQYSGFGGTRPAEGNGFAATNARRPGDSISQTTAVAISPGDTFCAEASLTALDATGGPAGVLALWLMGGRDERSVRSVGRLSADGRWSDAKTCVTATALHDRLRVQFYPAPGGATVGLDAVSVHQTLNANAGFNHALQYWNTESGTAATTYTAANRIGTLPYEGTEFSAVRSATPGGSIFTDMPRQIMPGQTFCAEAKVVTAGRGTGAAGGLYVYLTGQTASEESHSSFNDLPGGNNWRTVKTCVTATRRHTGIRLQAYPALNGHILGLDAMEVYESIAQNGGFNTGSEGWEPSGRPSYMQFGHYESTAPYEGTGFEVIQSSAPGMGLHQTRGWDIAPGQTFCAEAAVTTPGSGSGASGALAVWLLGGAANTAEVSTAQFADLPGNNWRTIRTCVQATKAHRAIRVHVYPAAGGPPLAVDAIDVR